ncbi:hypothetical protein FNV43_RR19238 [Rhamnella rubrinervis]|uniref:CMP/dCMP-type deaminase domain-containing protein n=1 Tax=Rhamnella rubrinervis TaxID=2594499 RepID=A0A8K0GTP0_9ROSA|nr:hypothetical protein FNV43_RR19238 [Rhamnella rubrinervis]
MMKLYRLLEHSRNQLSRKPLNWKGGDVRDVLSLHALSYSTAGQKFDTAGSTAGKIFAPYTIFKGKAALSVTPLLPTFTKLESGNLVVDRRGSMMLKFLPAIGERKYDNERRQIFCLSATEVGSLISLGADDSCEFFHDPSMLSSNAGQVRKSLSIKPNGNGSGYFVSLTVVNNIQKTKDNLSVPVTNAEFAVMKTACSWVSESPALNPTSEVRTKGLLLACLELTVPNNMDAWQIIHVPEKPPIPPDQQPTVDVFASVIEPKLANTLVRSLNKIAPMEDFRHVKRVKKKYVEGKTQLSVILCLACENGDQCRIPQGVQELINSYQLSAFVTKVCKYAASSKEEWEEQCKLWPTSYHPHTYSIDGITGFSEEDSQSVFSFMNSAIQLAKSGVGSVVNAAVIVDPSAKLVIASACDQIRSWHTPTDEFILETSSSKQPEAFASRTDSNGVISCKTICSDGFSGDSKRLYTGVSCLHPWQWAEQQTHMSSCYWHPLRHAAIVAIETSAARDIHLFPSSGDIQDKSVDMNSMQLSSTGSPAKRQKTNFTNVKGDGNLDTCCEGSHSLSDRPYLCTGYDIYLVWEPCTMCAMALVHQRIRRIFFAFPNPNAGALGSVYRLQGERSLNHHYAVFRVLMPEEILDAVETCQGQSTSTVTDSCGL